ncbi:MAG: type III pantothenate kinase [Myxococcales bacterium]
MLLAIDVGNTNTVLGLYELEGAMRLRESFRVQTEKDRTGDEYGLQLHSLFEFAGLSMDAVHDVIISSVVPPMAFPLEQMCRRFFSKKPLFVGPGVKTGMPVLYDNPREVGADRIVNAVAAFERFQQGLIIVDFGTATTFDAVTPKGEYLGGAIAPGIGISMEALFQRASKLPRVAFERPEKVVGRNTVSSMQSGIVFGYVGLVDGICARMAAELGFPVKTVATGGLAPLIANVSERIEVVDDLLTLEGLRIIYQRNRAA